MAWCKWYVKAGFALVLPVVVVAALLIAFFNDVSVGDESSATPTIDPDRPLMVALGDSFISGEGAKAKQYLDGTNTKRNTCHRANSAYPYLVAKALDFRLVNATCSGAVTADIISRAQYPKSPEDVYGGRRQLEALKGTGTDLFARASDVDYVVLSIGGNDAGFKNIVLKCLEERDCRRHGGAWLKRLDEIGPRLQETYRQIVRTTPRARHIVMTYPQLMVPASCIPQLTPAEIQWVNSLFLPELRRLIDFYGTLEGFEVVDNTDAFDGARVCEHGQRTKGRAANIFKFTQVNGQVVFDSGSLTRGSFHPTPLGHSLLATRLQHEIETVAKSPQPCTAQCPPAPPPTPPVLPPGSELTFPTGSRCLGERLADEKVVNIAADTRDVTVLAAPRSRYCFREWEQAWHDHDASASGAARISTAPIRNGTAGSMEALTQDAQGHWHRTVITPVSPPEVGQTPIYDELPFQAIVLAVLLEVAIAAVPWGVCRRKRRT